MKTPANKEPVRAAASECLVIIPAHNEENTIGDVISRIRSSGFNADIVVVDDYSSDNTAQVLRELEVKVLSPCYNLGYCGALQTGYKYALKHGYKYVCQLDGDGQHAPEHLPELYNLLKDGKADLVVGSRHLGKELCRVPFAKRVGQKLFSLITSLIIHQRITDPTSGYQAFNRKVVSFMTCDVFPQNYPDADLIIMAHNEGFKIREIPVEMTYRKNMKSMHSGVLKPLRYIIEMTLAILITLLRGRARQRDK